MRIAVFHNYMDNIGGAEMVALYLARGLNADIYTTNIDAEKIKKMGFEDVLPRIHSIGKIPLNAPFRQQIAFWKFRKLNLGTQYDFYIIAGDWAMSGAVHNKPNMWYAHSPLNELWEFRTYIKTELLKQWKRPLYEIWVWFNRLLSLKYAKSVDVWVCNSENTKARIKKYYTHDAEVIYPPVFIPNPLPKKDSKKEYWLSVNRLVRPKRIEIQMKAFSQLQDEHLIIVGSYEKGSKHFETYKTYLESIKPSNVEILNWVTAEELAVLHSECKGFITTAQNEDFGMAPIEAMAYGKPAIAPNEGGYTESILNEKTGILIDNIDEEKVIEAIKKINLNLNIDPSVYENECRKQSQAI